MAGRQAGRHMFAAGSVGIPAHSGGRDGAGKRTQPGRQTGRQRMRVMLQGALAGAFARGNTVRHARPGGYQTGTPVDGGQTDALSDRQPGRLKNDGPMPLTVC